MGKFQFKQFAVDDSNSAMKVGTDGVLLGAWADVTGAKSVLDIGCGSGLISLMMAQRISNVTITGVEIDEGACIDAEFNCKMSKWAERIKIVNADIREFNMAFESPLLILSNPPFFTEKLQSPDASRAKARHESGFGIKELIEISSQLMKSDYDSLAFIAPAGRDEEIEFILALNRLRVMRRGWVYSKEGKNAFRTLWQVGKDGPNCVHHSEISYLCIRNKDNEYTHEYINLTSDFYLDK